MDGESCRRASTASIDLRQRARRVREAATQHRWHVDVREQRSMPHRAATVKQAIHSRGQIPIPYKSFSSQRSVEQSASRGGRRDRAHETARNQKKRRRSVEQSASRGGRRDRAQGAKLVSNATLVERLFSERDKSPHVSRTHDPTCPSMRCAAAGVRRPLQPWRQAQFFHCREHCVATDAHLDALADLVATKLGRTR